MTWWEVIGWTGSALVVPSVRRFRRLNLAGSLIATVYNLAFGIWPYAAMNAAIAVIDTYWLLHLRRAGEQRYTVCPARADDALVTGFIERHRAGIEQAYPGALARLDGSTCFLTLRDDELVGLFAMTRPVGGSGDAAPADRPARTGATMTTAGEPDGAGSAQVLIDWVTDRFRDLRPGRTLYAHPALAAHGVHHLVVDPAAVADAGYFEKVGFGPGDGLLPRTL